MASKEGTPLVMAAIGTSIAQALVEHSTPQHSLQQETAVPVEVVPSLLVSTLVDSIPSEMAVIGTPEIQLLVGRSTMLISPLLRIVVPADQPLL